MTKEERMVAQKLLDQIEPGLVKGPAGLVARVSTQALRALILGSHGAADHATRPRKARRPAAEPVAS